MEALSEDEEPQTPIEEFLKPLSLVQHRQTMRQLGFDNPATYFKAQTLDDAQDMKTALLDDGVPLGHAAKIMRSASALRPSTSSAYSPLDPRLEPVLWSNPIPADGVLQQVEPTWSHASLSMTVPTSAGQCALVQSSLDQATVRREKEHQDKVCQATARHARRLPLTATSPTPGSPCSPKHMLSGPEFRGPGRPCRSANAVNLQRDRRDYEARKRLRGTQEIDVKWGRDLRPAPP